MLNPISRLQTPSIRYQFATVCQQIHLGDGCECSYSQVTINTILKTIACSFRSGADGAFCTTSVVISNDTCIGAIVFQPHADYFPTPELHCFQSFEQYTELIDCEFEPDDLSFQQLVALFEDIEFILQGDDGFPESIQITTDNIDLFDTLCQVNDNLEPLTTASASA